MERVQTVATTLAMLNRVFALLVVQQVRICIVIAVKRPHLLGAWFMVNAVSRVFKHNNLTTNCSLCKGSRKSKLRSMWRHWF